MTNPPEKIGKYKIISVLGAGGMGTVYLAEHPQLKRQVVIKKLTFKGGGGVIRQRFNREAQIMMDLSSPYVVRLYDFFTEGRSDYIVLEYVEGMALDRLLAKQRAIPPQLAMLIFLDVCLGLKNAHAKGIVHRDIKPGNILMSRRAEVKLADFGIASSEKERDGEEDKGRPTDKTVASSSSLSKSITIAGSSIGTPAYMSPEQLRDSSSVDKRADIYSMGVMLYEMVTGSKPFAGDMHPDTIAKIKRGEYVAPGILNRSLPLLVRSLIKRMMKVNPKKRYQTVEPVIKKIKHYLKRYDTHEIRVSLAKSIISQNMVQYPEYAPKHYKMLKILEVVAICAATISLFAFAWKRGVIYNTVLRNWYTPVSLTLEMPSASSQNADVSARAFFFIDDNSDIPELENSRRAFYVRERSENSLVCSTKPVYLKQGNYRIKVVEGPYIWWRSLKVGSEKLDLNLDFLKESPRKLRIHLSAEDAVTGTDITWKSKFFMQKSGKWRPISKDELNSLNSGAIYKFLLCCEGYFDQYFSVRIECYQDELFIKGSMRKK